MDLKAIHRYDFFTILESFSDMVKGERWNT